MTPSYVVPSVFADKRRSPAARQRVRLRMGTVLTLCGLCFPLVGGKWGSYIGLPGFTLFATDLCFATAAVAIGLRALLAFGLGPGSAHTGLRGAPPAVLLTITYLLIGTLCCVFFLLGNGSPLVRLRDLIPFAGLLLLPVVATAFMELGSARSERYLWLTSCAHAMWAVPALLNILPALTLPAAFFGFPVFTPRPDIDVPLLAIFVLFLVRGRGGTRPLRILLGALCLAAGLSQTSRAALGSALLAVLCYALLRRGVWSRRPRQVVGLILFCATVLVALAIALQLGVSGPAGGALQRTGLVGSSATAQIATESGQGTALARNQAWSTVINYWRAQGAPLLGLGPGTEIVADSGAVAFLSGDPSVRSPHNWWVGCLTRFGPLGLAAYGLSISTFMADAVRGRRLKRWRAEDIFLPQLALCVVLALLTAATLGVVIESPFGTYTLVLMLALLRVAKAPALSTDQGTSF